MNWLASRQMDLKEKDHSGGEDGDDDGLEMICCKDRCYVWSIC